MLINFLINAQIYFFVILFLLAPCLFLARVEYNHFHRAAFLVTATVAYLFYDLHTPFVGIQGENDGFASWVLVTLLAPPPLETHDETDGFATLIFLILFGPSLCTIAIRYLIHFLKWARQ